MTGPEIGQGLDTDTDGGIGKQEEKPPYVAGPSH